MAQRGSIRNVLRGLRTLARILWSRPETLEQRLLRARNEVERSVQKYLDDRNYALSVVRQISDDESRAKVVVAAIAADVNSQVEERLNERRRIRAVAVTISSILISVLLAVGFREWANRFAADQVLATERFANLVRDLKQASTDFEKLRCEFEVSKHHLKVAMLASSIEQPIADEIQHGKLMDAVESFEFIMNDPSEHSKHLKSTRSFKCGAANLLRSLSATPSQRDHFDRLCREHDDWFSEIPLARSTVYVNHLARRLVQQAVPTQRGQKLGSEPDTRTVDRSCVVVGELLLEYANRVNNEHGESHKKLEDLLNDVEENEACVMRDLVAALTPGQEAPVACLLNGLDPDGQVVVIKLREGFFGEFLPIICNYAQPFASQSSECAHRLSSFVDEFCSSPWVQTSGGEQAIGPRL